MARYRPTHSSRERERCRTAAVRRKARLAGVAGSAVLLVGVTAVVLLGGGDVAWRTFSGQELKEREVEVRASFEESEPASPEDEPGSSF